MTPTGIILLAHEVLGPISDQEMINALCVSYKALPRDIVRIKAIPANLDEIENYEWVSARQAQESEFQTLLKPLLQQGSGKHLLYFGQAPIPLAIALGYAISQFPPTVEIFLKTHGPDATWFTPAAIPSVAIQLVEQTLSIDRILAPGDVTIRIGLSTVVHTDETAEVIPEPLADLEIQLTVPGRDAITSSAAVTAVVAKFAEVLIWCKDHRPAGEIHLFFSGGTGVAFLLGTQVSSTMNAPVSCYNFTTATSPKYTRAFGLQNPGISVPALSDADRQRAALVRTLAQEELTRIGEAIPKLGVDGKKTWIQNIFPDASDEMFGEHFRLLNNIVDADTLFCPVDLVTTQVADGFQFAPESRVWRFDDSLLHAIDSKFSDENAVRLALRLFFMHEAIHRGTHRLKVGLNLRKFPKVVEELDYQADTWAFLHELAMLRLHGTDALRTSLIMIVKMAISTFWAFDATVDPTRIEVRRINRYLIWYWQKMRLEAVKHENDLLGLLKIMGDRPIIEVTGPTMKSGGDRVFFLLDQIRAPELAFVSAAQLNRVGDGDGTPVGKILSGFRNRDDDVITNAMRQVFDSSH